MSRVKLTVTATLILFAGAIVQAAFQQPHTPLQNLAGATWTRRNEGLQTLLKSKVSLADPKTQHALVNALVNESKDPTWEALAESPTYDEYYDDLIQVVQRIALQSHSAKAWKALIESNYNDDSGFAKWLASRPDAIPYLFACRRSASSVVTLGRVDFVLAEALAPCRSRSDSPCDVVSKDRILALLRSDASNTQSDDVRLSAVRGLGLCGTEQDLPLLSRLATSNTDKWFLRYVEEAKNQIEARAGSHSATK